VQLCSADSLFVPSVYSPLSLLSKAMFDLPSFTTLRGVPVGVGRFEYFVEMVRHAGSEPVREGMISSWRSKMTCLVDGSLNWAAVVADGRYK
jgi:hypothetical protein